MPSIDTIAKQHRHHWRWIWLSYAGFLFIAPIVEPSLWLWLGTIVAFLLFCPIYAAYFGATQSSVHHSSGEGNAITCWAIAATFVLGLLVYPWNAGGSAFFIYVMAFLPFSISSMRRLLWIFLMECVAVLLESYLFQNTPRNYPLHTYWTQTLITLFLMLTMGLGNLFMARQHRMEAKLLAAQDENIALAAVAERERIARDLHDVLGHTLSVIILKAELAGRLVSLDAERAVSEIGEVERTARSALKEIRAAIVGYRTHGMSAEIESARCAFKAADVMFETENLPQLDAVLSLQEETALCLGLREAVTNIVRHAHATRCRLRFLLRNGQRQWIIEDDGPRTMVREGNGLRGMRERIEALGGHVFIESPAGEGGGTRLMLELPPQAGDNR